MFFVSATCCAPFSPLLFYCSLKLVFSIAEGRRGHVIGHFCRSWCWKQTSCVTVLAGFMLLCNVKCIRNTNAVSMSSSLVEILESVWFMGFTEKLQYCWNVKISVISATSLKMCSHQCNVQKCVGDSNVSQWNLVCLLCGAFWTVL